MAVRITVLMGLSWFFVGLSLAQERAFDVGTIVIPVQNEALSSIAWQPQEEIWVRVGYKLAPDEDPFFVEPAEKIVWVGELAMLFLGATGDPVPHRVINRGMAWIELTTAEGMMHQEPIAIYPRRDRMRLHPDQTLVQKALHKRLAGVDASYLSQVAHFLAGNLADLEVMGTSYTVSGYGPIVNDMGEWVGEPIPEVDGSTTNELQALFQTVTANTGSTTANSTSDSLMFSGTTGINTQVVGDSVLIGLSANALDFTQLTDSMTLDATTTFDLDTNGADLNIDNASLFIDGSENRIGIGTDTPDQDLHLHQGNFLQTPANPIQVELVATGGFAGELVAKGGYLYALNASTDLDIYDISANGTLQLISSTTLGSLSHKLVVEGKYAYLINLTSSVFTIIDIANATNPTVRGVLNIGTTPKAMDASGAFAYVVDGTTNDLRIIDVSDPDRPIQIGSIGIGSNADSIKVYRGYAYVVDTNTDDLKIINVSDPRNPVQTDALPMGPRPNRVVVSGRYAYITDTLADNISVIDISDPTDPAQVGTIPLGNSPTHLEVLGRYVFVTDTQSDDLRILDLEDPTNPVQVGIVSIGFTSFDIAVDGRFVFISGGVSEDIRVLELSSAEMFAAKAQSFEAGQATIRNDLTTQGTLSVQGGINVGSAGIFSGGQVGIGADLTVAGNIAIKNATAPTTSIAEGVQLYAQDVSTSSELRVRDEAGNITTLSPHNFSLIGAPSEPLAWSYFSQFGDTKINVDMLKTVRLVEQLSGEKLVHLQGSQTSKAAPANSRLTALEKENETLKQELAAIKALLGMEE